MLAILGAAREPSCFDEMLASAGNFETWSGPRVIHWAGLEGRPMPGWLTLHGPRDGTAKAMMRVLAFAEEAGAEQLLICEDDIRFDPGAVELLDSYQVPTDLPLVAFFQVGPPPPEPGLERVSFHKPAQGDKGRFAHMQAIILRREAILAVLASEQPKSWARPYGDKLLGRILYPRWRHYGVHWPLPVEHIGAVSSYGWDSAHIRRHVAPVGPSLG